MPQRLLRPGIRSSKRWNRVGFLEQSLYIRLISLVDDFGRYEADPELLRSEAFPYGSPDGTVIPIADVHAALNSLFLAGLITLYEVDLKRYLQINRWTERARSVSKYPAPLDENHRGARRETIYFIQGETTKRVKIGYTGNGAAKRLAQLQVGCTEKLVILIEFLGTKDEESDLHEKFCSYSLAGEWFEWSDSIQTFVQSRVSDNICCQLPATASNCQQMIASPPQPQPSPQPEPAPVRAQLTADGEIPTLKEVMNYGSMASVPPDSCQRFFDHHQGQNLWVNQFNRLIDWRHKLVSWGVKDRNVVPNTRNSNGFVSLGLKIKLLDEKLANHKANPESISFDSRHNLKDREDFKALRQQRRTLSEQALA